MKEIEKKYLINKMPEELSSYKSVKIEQGYLVTSGNPILRVRKYDDEYILTYKYRLESSNEINKSKEVELPLSEETYNYLKSKIDGKIIEKTRYLIPLENNLTAELDIFEGYLDGLVFVEVEFESEEEIEKFKLPDWFGKDITSDKRFINAYLATIDSALEILNDL